MDFFAYSLPDARYPGGVHIGVNDGGGDGCTSAWEIFQGGDGEVSEAGEGDGARDGGGGHDQRVGCAIGGAFVREDFSLPDSETVLFIDDDEAEAEEFYAFLEKCLSTDNDAGLACHYVEEGLSFGSCG